MEVVATRDIERGEEVYIDYGDRWQEAWEEHVENWRPPAEDSRFFSYTSVTEMNNNRPKVRTDEELRRNPYPDNVEILCSKSEKHEFVPCSVVARDCEEEDEDDCSYFIRSKRYNSRGIPIMGTSKPVEVSRESIMFGFKKYSTDQNMPGTFRHPIGVPEGMWPEHWMNLKET